LNLIERMGLYDVLASPAVYCLALLLAGRGKPEEAARLARENQRRAVRLGLKAVVRNTELIEAELALRQGNLSAAGRWLRKQAIPDPLPEQGLNHTILLLAARVHLAKQDYARVSSILAFLEEKARRKGAIPDLVGVLITQARLGQAQGDLEGRSHFLREAVDLAAAHHCVRAFYPLEDLREPLETFRGRAPGLVQTLLGDPEHPARPGLEGIIDPPSLRELEILRLAAAGLSNQGISDRLYISVGTIKWHLNHLYAKLGASSRTQATVKAREMGLL
jgi:LuxR family maltose regulon positive regulatory protein